MHQDNPSVTLCVAYRTCAWVFLRVYFCFGENCDAGLHFVLQVLPALMRMLSDSVPRIVAHTANAIVNFMDEADVEYTQPYLDELVTKLLMVLQNSTLKFVNEEVCISAQEDVGLC